MVTATVIWVIGWAFTVGLTIEKTQTLDEIGAAILLAMFWPLILGCEMREKLDE